MQNSSGLTGLGVLGSNEAASTTRDPCVEAKVDPVDCRQAHGIVLPDIVPFAVSNAHEPEIMETLSWCWPGSYALTQVCNAADPDPFCRDAGAP